MQSPITFDSSPLMKLFDAAILTVAFVFNAVVLDAEWQSLAIAVGGSLSGSVVLAYFRRDSRKMEQIFKVLASSIGGLVLGTVMLEYFHIEMPAYRLGLFFFTSMLALVVLKALLTMTEQNASDVVRGLLQRVFNLRVEAERTKKRVRRNEKRIEQIEKEGD